MVFRKVRGTDSVAVTDLRTVAVVETVELGRSTGSQIIFTTAEGRGIRFPRNAQALRTVSAAALRDWFADRLAPAGVEVTHERSSIGRT